MGLGNCSQCGKVYVENPMKLCPVCMDMEEEAEQKVSQFLRSVDKASISDIHEATGVDEKTIFRMMKRGRVLSDFQIMYPCESCGELIYEGRLCEVCSRNITSQLKPAEWKAPERQESRRQSDGIYSNKFNK